ncbi:hypothetical protein INQ93_03755 [Chlamydia suis]|uniref:Uncharacterized protein n=1 Tax=Chlamydia suis TaxID=83559 RepID=A0AAQ0EMX1_9CHLA|nr:hypothetical protein [Chlamydia suis]MEB2681036.1 hypothetical protein [Chlamydia suis]MEB2682094.1 hypothetical protein [Chlamydia suis]MEB2683017.1 hypothetical protein [Chlamydia suis]MEB2683744.1 hypothetical protein [Chlamydia suis]MEB2684831.1 hypothetical protein [Chlamydia suis]
MQRASCYGRFSYSRYFFNSCWESFVLAGWTAMPLLNVIFSLIILGAVMLGAVLGKFLKFVKQSKQLSSKEFFIEKKGQKMAEIAKEEGDLAIRQAQEEMEAILQSIS